MTGVVSFVRSSSVRPPLRRVLVYGSVIICLSLTAGILLGIFNEGPLAAVTPPSGGPSTHHPPSCHNNRVVSAPAGSYESVFASDACNCGSFTQIDEEPSAITGGNDDELLAALESRIRISRSHVVCPSTAGRGNGSSSGLDVGRSSTCHRATLSTERNVKATHLIPCERAIPDNASSTVISHNNNNNKVNVTVYPPRHRLLCITYTIESSHHKAAAMYKTWGTQCDQHLIFTNGTSIDGVPPEDVVHSLPARGKEEYDNIWQKIRSIHSKIVAFSFPQTGGILNVTTTTAVRHRVQPFDYVFFGGDDVFLFVPNLRRYLMEQPYPQYVEREGGGFWLGYRYDWDGNAFISGAGYVMNAFAFHQLVDLSEPICGVESLNSAEDMITADCLGYTGIEANDARDEWGMNRFLPLHLRKTLEQCRNNELFSWYKFYHDRPQETPPVVISQYVNLLHYLDIPAVQRYYDAHIAPQCRP